MSLSSKVKHQIKSSQNFHMSDQESSTSEVENPREDEDDNELKLIKLVRKNPILWDSSQDSYKDAQKKPAVWKAIANKLGGDEEDSQWTTGRPYC